MFFDNILEISDIEFDQSSNSNLSVHVGVDILNLLFLCDFFLFFHVW